MISVLTISGMMAVHARRAVFTALAGVPGVASAEVELGRAVVEHDATTTHEALRVVMWLAQHTGGNVTTGELAGKLGLSDECVEEALDALVEAGLVRGDGGAPRRYHYQARHPELDAALQRTLMLAEQDNLEVARMLAANSIYRLRRLAYLAYAEALLKVSACNVGRAGSQFEPSGSSQPTTTTPGDPHPPDGSA